MTNIETLKLALEALENTTPTGFNMERDKQFYAAITALRTAIAEAEKQEPVAWAEEIITDLHALYDSEMITENDSGDALIRLDAAVCAVEEAEQRHTAPAAAQRQPLTEDQIDDIWNRYCDEMGEASINDAYDIARAIEAAHGIKGES